MDTRESRADVRTAPVFVDASGRRRRGVAVAGWFGAAACTAYLAAFGITLSTNAGVVEVVGQTLTPSPYVDDEGDDDGAEDLPADTVVATAPAHRTPVVEAVAVTKQAPQARTSGRHARTEPVASPRHGGTTPPRVTVHRVPRHAAPTVPVHHPVRHEQHHAGGVVAGTPHSTPDAPSHGGGTAGGGSSSGGADPTTGTGTGTGTPRSDSPGSGTPSTGTTGTGTTTSPGGTTSDPVLCDVLTTTCATEA
ncbi:hypothetical protein GCM10023200_01760 [Actinomycetospora chlora]|uniref:Uncharacterized protein n=1 Tax=Actinomycetospora chlora TaxID=663608 RepID=A0ABP9A4T6_9PSEU